MTKIKSKYHIHNSINAMRKLKGITQLELAEKLEITRATLISLEKGNYNPSLDLAFRLADFFECDIEDIFTPKAKEEAKKYYYRPREMDFLD